MANVPCNCFMPRPNVDSAVIRLTRYEEPPVQVKDEKMLFKIIRASFNQRRKTLQNGLNNSSELNFTKDQIAAAIAEAGFSPSVRGEALTLEQFAKLTDILLKRLEKAALQTRKQIKTALQQFKGIIDLKKHKTGIRIVTV